MFSGFFSFTVIKKRFHKYSLNPLSKSLSPHISTFYGEGTISGPESFTVQYNPGIICWPVQHSWKEGTSCHFLAACSAYVNPSP